MRALSLVLLAVGLQAAPAAGQGGDFARHPSPPAYQGRHAPLRLSDARSRRFASALADAADGPIDFAGRYVLAEIGCGAGCITFAAIDARTGRASWFPSSVSNWPKAYAEPLEYRVDSRLVLVHGQVGEKGSVGPHAFVFDGKAFKRIDH